MMPQVSSPTLDFKVENAEPFLHSGIVGGLSDVAPPQSSRLSNGSRRFVIYPATSGFDILEDIDRVCDYALEPNVFFAPRFAVPAMPRLDDRNVRLMLMQDGGTDRPETRFLMPFSVEKPGFAVGPDIIRAWSTPYGPLGTPIVERREAGQILDDLIATLGSPEVNLPGVLVLPDVVMDSPVITALRGVAVGRGLPVMTTGPVKRPFLKSEKDSVDYFKDGLGGHHRRNYGRLRRQLEAQGTLEYDIARSSDAVRVAMEEFLLLENAGWKGRQKTSLAADRYRVAFAREAINSLAERDNCRIHSLKLDGRVIASLIVFVQAGHAWTWKTTYDEAYAAFSPGTLLMIQVTETHLDDPNIDVTDSCAVEDHPVMTRLWTERRDFTHLVIGLRPNLDKDVRQVTSQMELYRSTRQAAKLVRDRVRGMMRKR